MLNYNYIFYFKKVAELCSLTEAARELYISQPALSQAIKYLEYDFKLKLFIKDGRNIALSPEGENFYNLISSSIDTLDDSIQKMKNLSKNISNEIRVAIIGNTIYTDITNDILKFQNSHKNVEIKLEFMQNEDAIKCLNNHSVDFALCRSIKSYSNIGDIRYKTVFEESLDVVVSAQHHLHERENVSIEDIKDEKFIFLSNKGSLVAERYFKDKDINLNVIDYVSNDLEIANLVSINKGISFVPHKFAIPNGLVKKIKLNSEPSLTTSIYLAWHKDALINDVKREFVKYILPNIL